MLIRQSSGPGSGNGPALPELHRRLKWVALIGIGALFVLRRPALAAPGHARRELLRAHGLERGQGALPAVGARQDPRPQGRLARRQSPGVQHLRDAQAAHPAARGRARRGCSGCPTTRSPRSTSASRSARKRDPKTAIADPRGSGPRSRRAGRAVADPAARRRGPPRAVSLLSAGRSRRAPDRLHDADDRGRGREARQPGLRRQRARRPLRPRGQVGELPARQEGRSSATRSTRAASGSTTRPRRR